MNGLLLREVDPPDAKGEPLQGNNKGEKKNQSGAVYIRHAYIAILTTVSHIGERANVAWSHDAAHTTRQLTEAIFLKNLELQQTAPDPVPGVGSGFIVLSTTFLLEKPPCEYIYAWPLQRPMPCSTAVLTWAAPHLFSASVGCVESSSVQCLLLLCRALVAEWTRVAVTRMLTFWTLCWLCRHLMYCDNCKNYTLKVCMWQCTFSSGCVCLFVRV